MGRERMESILQVCTELTGEYADRIRKLEQNLVTACEKIRKTYLSMKAHYEELKNLMERMKELAATMEQKSIELIEDCERATSLTAELDTIFKMCSPS
jgi:hypothetical protein